LNTVVNLRVPEESRIFWQTEWLSPFQIMSCTME
jgi:hypothetical protein